MARTMKGIKRETESFRISTELMGRLRVDANKGGFLLTRYIERLIEAGLKAARK